MSDPNIGRLLASKYELVRLLGQGGMGAVYEGRNQIGKRVAVKLLLKPEFAANRDLTARFFREAQASAAVESKHVVDVYDTGVDGDTGFPFIIMAYLNGEDLEHIVERVGALNPVAAVRIASQAAIGLAKAHDAGIVHRDIKPANLYLATDDTESVVKILDFGIAKLTTESLAPASGEPHALTQTGAMLGTPLYMSPEQAQGLKTVDARTDIWSLGMCLYQALAGRLPFADVDTIGKLIVAIVAHEVPPLLAHAPWVSPELAAIVHWALERDVAKRAPSARELCAALAPFSGDSLVVTPSLLVGVKDSLDATLAPGMPSGSSSARSVSALATSGTTAGFASERTRPASNPRSRRTAVALAAAGALGVAAVSIGVIHFGGGTRGVASVGVTAPPRSNAPVEAAATTSAAPPVPADEMKVGVLNMKLPAGFSVKVDGFIPGSPESQGTSRRIDDDRLELRGEFQRKFLVAVFDRSGKRVMVQDVYLYDNKLDPPNIDPGVGVIAVERPKRKALLAPTEPKPAPPSGADLPARF